ncbi:Polypeptide N-acetylgalactosaminyltransferase 5 [Orchesella cincta]|uniref:Polypeptide N-acetylgalactosaminyltransferase n=1 Tax=Orchesella cincta TaxID=48709 RepID=A0A1D2N7E6_ORCCI|nr:Polypeptide N-acetylgalactosaminyltransferase 5 [Orchesella cincta]
MRKKYPHPSSFTYSQKSRNKSRNRFRTLQRILILFGLVVWVIVFAVVAYFFFEIELSLLSNTAVIKDMISKNGSDITDFSEQLPPPALKVEEILGRFHSDASNIFNLMPKRKPRVDGSKYMDRKNAQKKLTLDEGEVIDHEMKEIIAQDPSVLQEIEKPEVENTEHLEPPTQNIFPEVEASKMVVSSDLQLLMPEVLTASGIGENGAAVNIDDLSEDEKQELGQGKEHFGYNEIISKKINVHRTIPDGRDPGCLKKDYSKLRQTASVIISVYNEGWSVLLRTIHSILDRSPDKLLKEIIIIDDCSDSHFGYMQQALPKYLSTFSKVKLFRMEQRQGVVKARLFGVEKAKGDIIIFLDSHIEVNKVWLEPLIERIEANGHHVCVPVLDQISPETFQYTPSPKTPFSEIFMWDLNMFRNTPQNVNQENADKPMQTPVSKSGQFAISKAFFEKLGKFDPGLEHYGAENLELSLKVWLCGGRLEIIPCSRIGHVERPRMPYLLPFQEQIDRSLLRVATVWMDDHVVYYKHSKKSLSTLQTGDITDRLLLKKNLNCKSFEWYLEQVYPSLYNPRKSNIVADGQIRSLGMDGSLCVDSASQTGSIAILFPCHGLGGNQRWWYTEKGEIRRYDQCLDYWGDKIKLYPCHGQKGNQRWIYTKENQRIKHPNSKKCLRVITDNTFGMDGCDETSYAQLWEIENLNVTAYNELNRQCALKSNNKTLLCS